MNVSSDTERTDCQPQGRAVAYVPVLLLFIAIFGLFSHFLQSNLYQHQAPFFDSVQYYDRVYEIVSVRQQQGIVAAIEYSALKPSTICFPYFLSVLLSYILPASRGVGVWIEVFYLTVFLFSLAEYLRRVVRVSALKVLLGIAPVLMMTALYRWNSGITDLRVDLPCAFLYGSTACWWLIGRSQYNKSKWLPFVLAGICAGIACLTRAIAPIYLASGFIPLLLLELARTPRRSQFLMQAAVAIGIAVVISAWFYIIQFKFIYFYYAVWNTDANAGVSLTRSIKHFGAAYKSIGVVVTAYLVLSVIAVAKNRPTNKNPVQKPTTDIDALKLLWLGLAPVLLLVVKRADINPFVSLPGSIGIVLAGIVYMFPRVIQLPVPRQIGIGISACVLILVACSLGFYQHVFNDSKTMSAQQQLVSSIQSDARQQGRKQVSYSVSLLACISPSSLKSILQFDRNSRYVDEKTVEVEGIRFKVVTELMNPSKANWDRLKGENDEQKIDWLEQFALAKIDYIVTPDLRSVPMLKRKYSSDYSMNFADEIITIFSNSENWMPISEKIEIDPGVFIQLRKNVLSTRMTSRSKASNSLR